jgi:hypothetical protein
MTTTKILSWCLWTLMLAAMATYAWAQDPAKPTVSTHFKKVEATIEAINGATREISVGGPKRVVTVVASPELKNFDKLHVGDKVIVSYYEGIAAKIAKGGSTVAEPAASTFASPKKGGTQPGGIVGASVTTTVTIEDIDTSTNTVAFRRPDGSVRIIAVRSPEMQQFIRTLKPGDSVEVTYTESVAVDVVPATH